MFTNLRTFYGLIFPLIQHDMHGEMSSHTHTYSRIHNLYICRYIMTQIFPLLLLVYHRHYQRCVITRFHFVCLYIYKFLKIYQSVCICIQLYLCSALSLSKFFLPYCVQRKFVLSAEHCFRLAKRQQMCLFVFYYCLLIY